MEYTLVLVTTKKEENNKQYIGHTEILNELKSTLWKDFTINFENNIKLYDNNESFIITKNDIKTDKEIGYEILNNRLHEWLGDRLIDFYFKDSKHFNNDQRRLAVFDMDSCIIKNECIDEMAEIMGVSEKVSTITARAMAGELDFNQALMERLSLLNGMTIEQLEQVWKKIQLNSGSFSLIKTLKSLGFKTALVSGGFSYFAFRVASRLGMDYAVSNQLEFTTIGNNDDNNNNNNNNNNNKTIMTGKVIGDIINGEMKKKVTILLKDILGLEQSQIISMGDGSNDKLMIQYSDMGVAYHGKPILRAATPFQINFAPLSICSFYLSNIYSSPSLSTNLEPYCTSKTHIYDTSIHDLPENQALVTQYIDFNKNHLNK
ncbi:hypothetical protein RB653_005020 [Dictyostelium firmibasis]|uniref:phosphoserine phosphatase n=1 Tax=Dictyostelium firmibasis TaxID=79012 RepID=A0AAN7U3L0_9MYCE